MASTVLPMQGGSGKVVCVLKASDQNANGYSDKTTTKTVVYYDSKYFNATGNCVKAGKYNVSAFRYSTAQGDASASATVTIAGTSYDGVYSGVKIASGAVTVCSVYIKGTGTGSGCAAFSGLVICV